MVRHGETDGNVKDIAQGHYDASLNSNGRRQARLLADRLKDWRFDAVYCSDLKRTVQTVEPVMNCRQDSLRLNLCSELREKFYGECENMPWEEIRARYYKEFEWFSDLNDRPDMRFPGAESDRDVFTRVSKFAEELKDRHTDDDETVLIVAHGGSIRSLLAYMLDLRIVDRWRFSLENTSISVISDYEWGGDVFWRLTRLNDIGHLS